MGCVTLLNEWYAWMGPGLVLDVGQSVARWPAVSHKLSFVFPSPSLSFETTGRPHFFPEH